MAYDDSTWDVPPGQPASDLFPISRFLEYTDVSVEQRLKPVTEETLKFVQALPTIFMSELKTEHGLEYVNFRVGRILTAEIKGRDIHYTFVIDRDYGRLFVPDRQAFDRALPMGRWELSRSHWAVKVGDLPNVLASLPLPNLGPAIPPPPPTEIPNPAPVAGEIIDSVEAYIQHVLHLPIQSGEEVFYRGHSRTTHKLEPSLFRRNDKGEYKHRQHESKLVREILTAQANDFASDDYMLDKLVRMQHYGLPTRLLDVSLNPLVALYFACSNNPDVDGEVIVMRTLSSHVRFFDSDTVSCIANLALLSEEEKDRLVTSAHPEAFNESESAQKLLHFIRREKPYFEGRIVPQDLDLIAFVRARNTNERIVSQSGAFLLFGKDSILPETGLSSLPIERITVRNKPVILGQLDKLNIKSSTIYPGIEKTTAEIAKKYESAN